MTEGDHGLGRRLLRRVLLRASAVLSPGLLSSCAHNPTPAPPPSPTPSWLDQFVAAHGGWFLVTILLLVVAVCLVEMWREASRQRWRRDADMLERGGDDIYKIGPLLEVLYGRDLQNRGVAATALVRLLPYLKAGDAGLLHPRQRACLLRALHHPDTYLVYAALKALEQIGGESDLRRVELLAGTTADADIRDAAHACLPALRERAAFSRSRQTLLRPAATAAEPATVLLRSARDTGESDPQQLLRAAPSEPGDER
jgi:hypothetical protein